MYKNINKKNNLILNTKLLKQDLYEIDSNLSQTAIITINNSNHLNAINNEILDNLIEVFRYYIQNQSVRTIILTGAGEKSFIAGADIKTMSEFTPNQAYDYSIKGHELISIMLSSTKPIIAAVNGFALGGGCEIASACHFRYSSPNAIFGQPEVKLGIIAGWGGTQNLPKIVGIAHALEMLVTGKTINAQDAYRIGLVNGVFEKDLIENVLKISKTINENSPNAISNTLSSINKSLNLDILDGLKIEAGLFKDSFENNESKIGLNSFIKKEKPKF